jgi:hypothetical protein
MKDNLKETEEALIDEALKKIYAVSGDPNKKISLILTGTEEENQIILDAMKEYYYEHLSQLNGLNTSRRGTRASLAR